MPDKIYKKTKGERDALAKRVGSFDRISKTFELQMHQLITVKECDNAS